MFAASRHTSLLVSSRSCTGPNRTGANKGFSSLASFPMEPNNRRGQTFSILSIYRWNDIFWQETVVFQGKNPAICVPVNPNCVGLEVALGDLGHLESCPVSPVGSGTMDKCGRCHLMARAGVGPRSLLILLRFPPFQHRALLQPPLTQLLPPPRVGRTCDTTMRTHPMTREEEPTPSDALGTSCRGLSPPTSHHISHRPNADGICSPFHNFLRSFSVKRDATNPCSAARSSRVPRLSPPGCLPNQSHHPRGLLKR